uniref:Uncharacterized protein MANES_04G109700 n=1 Tax=Rhizophora mucronata TaxID=61149 RepID=A0A2P2K1J0_RHIMU
MAGVPVLAAEVLLSRRVQEMVINGEEPQPPYVCGKDLPSADGSGPQSLIPIIDLSLISSLEPSTAQEELQKLSSALCSWGCFLVHDLSLYDAKLAEI